MAVETVAAPAAAPAASSAPSSSPASTSAPASSAPASTPSAPAAAPATTASPIAPAAAEPLKPNQGEGSGAFLHRVAEEKRKAAEAAAKPAETATPDKPAEVADPNAPPEEKTDEKPADAAIDPDEEEFTLDARAPLPTSELAKALTPELAAALEAAGIKKDSLFANARLAAKTAKYEQAFASPEEAIVAKQSADQFTDLSHMFVNAHDMNSTAALLSKIMEFDYVLDDEGKPVKGENGLIKTSGATGRFFTNAAELALARDLSLAPGKLTTNDIGGKFIASYFKNALDAAAKAGGDDDLKAALDVLTERGLLPRGTSAADEGDVPAELKAEHERLKTERESLARDQQAQRAREQEESTAKEQKFESDVATGVEKGLDDLIKSRVLGKADLADFNADQLLKDIKEEIYAKIKGNGQFFTQLDALMRRPMSNATLKARQDLAMKTARPLLDDAARLVFSKAGAKLASKQAADASKLDARQQASRSEQKGSSQPSAPATMPSHGELVAKVEKEYIASHGGSRPSTSQMMQLIAEEKRKYAGR